MAWWGERTRSEVEEQAAVAEERESRLKQAAKMAHARARESLERDDDPSTAFAFFANALEYDPDNRLIKADALHTLMTSQFQRVPLCSSTHAGGKIIAVSDHSNGPVIASLHGGNTIQIVGLESGQLICTPLRHQKGVEAAMFSPGGSIVVALGEESCAVWDIESGKTIGQIGTNVGRIWFSPAGDRIVSSSNDLSDAKFQIWNSETAKPIGETFSRYNIAEPMFGKDGRMVFIEYEDEVHRRDCNTGGLLGKVDRFVGIWASDISSTGDALVVMGYVPDLEESRQSHFVAEFMNTRTGQPFGKRLKFDDSWGEVTLGAGANLAALWEANSTTANSIVLWDIENNKIIGSEVTHTGYLHTVEFTPDGRHLISASFDQVRIWNVADGEIVSEITEHEGDILAIAVSPDGRLLVTAGLDGTAKVWGLPSGNMIGGTMMHENPVHEVWFLDDLSNIVTKSGPGHFLDRGNDIITVWNTASGSPIGIPIRESGHKNEHSFPPFATNKGLFKFVRRDLDSGEVWNVETYEPIGALVGHESIIESVAISTDASRLITGSLDSTAPDLGYCVGRASRRVTDSRKWCKLGCVQFRWRNLRPPEVVITLQASGMPTQGSGSQVR